MNEQIRNRLEAEIESLMRTIANKYPDSGYGKLLSRTMELRRVQAENAALKRENEKLRHVVDYVWQEIYETDEPVLSVASVEKLRNVGLLTPEANP